MWFSHLCLRLLKSYLLNSCTKWKRTKMNKIWPRWIRWEMVMYRIVWDILVKSPTLWRQINLGTNPELYPNRTHLTHKNRMKILVGNKLSYCQKQLISLHHSYSSKRITRRVCRAKRRVRVLLRCLHFLQTKNRRSSLRQILLNLLSQVIEP